MVKLIVSDLDGTLLTPDKQLPQETFELIEKLYSKGIIFAPASGRQLPNLKKLFAPVCDKIAIIAENGGLVWHDGEIIFSDPTDAKDVKYALDIVRKEQDLFPLLSCPDCAYYDSTDEYFVPMLKKSYSSYKFVNNMDEVIGKEIVLKISIWDKQVAAEHGGIILPPKVKGLRTIVSGYQWMDVSAPQASKGRALQALSEKLNLKREQIVCFGDHMNDLEMLQFAGKAYVTANAYPPLKAQVGEEIPSNDNFGVIQKLKEILNNEEI
jgi:hypothetical protein